METRLCKKCKTEKLVAEFPVSKVSIIHECRTCERIRRKANRDKNLEKYRSFARNYARKNYQRIGKNANLVSKYGLTLEQYNSLRDKQDYKCAICNKHESKFTKALHVDHNHKTGKVRGLLCDSCNRAIGHFKEDPKAIASAIEYIRTHTPMLPLKIAV